MNMYLGIDLHKKTSAWVLMDDKKNVVWKNTVACHPSDISASVAKLPVPAREIKVAIEPVCGWRWVTKQLEDEGLEVRIAHPQKMRLIAESKQKTDMNDARMLADILRAGMLPESHRIADDVYELRVLIRERGFLVSKRTDVKNRLHGLATAEGVLLDHGNNPLHKAGKKWIKEGENEIMQELLAVIDEMNGHIDILTQKIEKTAREMPQAKLLQTMPGIGPITALTVIAEVGDFSRFPKAEKLASFAGLVPRQRSSGEKIRLGPITHYGSRYLRSAMVEAAMRIRPGYAPELHQFVENLKPSCGAKRARVALARKMLTIMWAMIKSNAPYEHREKHMSPSSSAMRKESYLVLHIDA